MADSYKKPKQSWLKKKLLTGIGLANLATPSQLPAKPQLPQRRPQPTLQAKQNQVRNQEINDSQINDAPPQPQQVSTSNSEEQNFNDPLVAPAMMAGATGTVAEAEGEQGVASKLKDQAKEKVKGKADEVKNKIADKIKDEAKRIAREVAKKAAQALAEATSEFWLPILLVIIAVVLIVIGLVFFFKSAQHPSPTGKSSTITADMTKQADYTLGQHILALAGQAQWSDQDINALLSTAEVQINADMRNVKAGDKNYDQVQKLGTQGLALIKQIRTEIQASTDNTETVRGQLKQLADILSQLSGLTSINLANCPDKPLLKSGIAPAASQAMQCAGVSSTYAHPTQTVGNASASAGTHLAESGQNYSAATDLSTQGLSDGQVRDLIAKLDSVGFAAFYRDPGTDGWPSGDARHIHVVYLGVAMKPILQRQVKDYVNGRDGLGCHCHAYTFYQPPAEVKNMATALFLKFNPGVSL